MKTIVLGDTHGRDTWKKIVEENPEANRIIFIGDYFDAFHVSVEVQISNFLDIMKFKKEAINKEVVTLIGNHDFHYFSDVGNVGTSGYQYYYRKTIEETIEENKHHLRIAYAFDDFLCTHAGLSEQFWEDYLPDQPINKLNSREIASALNTLWDCNKFAFNFRGIDGTGDDPWQTPIWIRPASLLKSSKGLARRGIRQIVGHTQVRYIDPKGLMNQGKYYLIDAIGLGEYLIINGPSIYRGKTTK